MNDAPGGDGLPSFSPADVAAALAERSGDEQPVVVGVLLAAGTSTRFGEANKLLASLDGEPLVRHAARTLLDASLDRVVCVVGYEADAVRDALAGLDVGFASNPDYAAGLSTSVRTGVDAAADAGADAVVFLPGDMPAVAPGTVGLLRDAHRAGLGSALAAAHDGRRGNPVLFDARHFDALRAVSGDVGGRPVLTSADDAALVAVDDPGVRADVDTEPDLREHE